MEESLNEVPKYISNCPIIFDWCKYKGKIVFAGINYERSIKSKRPMIDIFHCATTAMNGCVLNTVQFNKNNFDIKNPFNQ